MSHATSTLLTLALAAGLVSACDRSPMNPAGVPKKPQAEQVASPQAPSLPSGIVSDASVPPAAQVLAQGPAESTQAAPTGQDTKAAQPMAELSKPDETNAMPKAMHGNNHSSPSNAGATSSKP